MEPRIIVREPFTILGVMTRITRGTETPGLFVGIWQQFEANRQTVAALARGTHYFGVNLPTDHEDVTDYVAGMVVDDDATVPQGLEKRRVPGGRFVVIECPVGAIGDTYRHIFTVWLREAAVEFDPAAPVFEEYPPDAPPQPVRIHVPVRG